MKQVIRIDKGDGSEEEVTREQMERAIKHHYFRPHDVLLEFDAGERIATDFAYYELREVSEVE